MTRTLDVSLLEIGFLYLLVLQVCVLYGMNFFFTFAVGAISLIMQGGCFARRVKLTQHATSLRPDVATVLSLHNRFKGQTSSF